MIWWYQVQLCVLLWVSLYLQAITGSFQLCPAQSVKPNSLVWSLSTHCCNDPTVTNMNLVTYANPVAIKPVETWALSLYKGTLSLENFAIHRTAVLQQLTHSHINSISLLGKTSGRTIDKIAELGRLGHTFTEVDVEVNLPKLRVLSTSPLLLFLQATVTPPIDLGDHWLYLCKVQKLMRHTDVILPEMKPLFTDYLRQNHII